MNLEKAINYDEAMYIKNGWQRHNMLLENRARNIRIDEALIKEWNDYKTFKYSPPMSTKKSSWWRMLIP